MLSILAGCSGSGPTATDSSTELDPEAARAALVASLDAWKQGQAVALANREPPIRFDDEDESSGLLLVDYKFLAPDAPIQANQDVPVRLTLRNSVGGKVERTTSYQIAPGPPIAVLRGD